MAKKIREKPKVKVQVKRVVLKKYANQAAYDADNPFEVIEKKMTKRQKNKKEVKKDGINNSR